jgi:hypothetical protein
MVGRPARSGGWNRKTAEEHRLHGTKPRGRESVEAPAVPLTDADRKRTLAGLPPDARRIARGLLDRYTGWDEAKLATLRHYSQSCVRVELLQADSAASSMALHRELRTNLALMAALGLPAGEV